MMVLLFLALQTDPFDEAVSEYRRGHVDSAYRLFEKALSHKQESEQVYRWVKRTGEDLIYGMINDADRKMRDMGRRLLDLARAGSHFRVDAATIKQALEDLKSDNFAIQRHAHAHLMIYGPFALQYVLPVLNDDAQDRLRNRVMLVLREMGPAVTLGVCEALEADPVRFALMRRNACIVLGNIGDARAIPALARCYEQTREKEAHVALQKLTGGVEFKKSVDYYYDLAQKFYYGHPEAIYTWDRSFKFWKWDKDKQVLTQRSVPTFAYNEQLCEEALFDLLDIDPDHAGAWSLLVMALVSQSVEAEFALRECPDDEDLKHRLKGVERVVVLAKMIGRTYVYEALRRSMKDGSGSLSAALCDVLAKCGRSSDLPPAPLTRRE